MTAPENVERAPGALHVLIKLVSGHGDPVEPRSTVAPWPEALEAALAAREHRVTWRHDRPGPVIASSGPGHLAVTADVRGWWVAGLDGTAHVRLVAPDGTTQRRAASELADAVVSWAIVDPELPAEPLAHAHTPWGRLRDLLVLERADVRALAAFAAVSGVLGLMTPLMVQVVVNTVAFGMLRQSLWVTTGLLLASLLAGVGLQLVERFLVEQIQRRLMARFAADLAARLPRIRREHAHGMQPTEMVNRFFDILTVQKSLAGLLIDGLDAILQAVFGLTLLALYHPALLGYSSVLVVLFVAVVFFPVHRATETSIGESKAKHAVAGWLEEIAAAPDLFRSPQGRALAAARADALSQKWLTVRDEHFYLFLRQFGGALTLTAIASAGLLALGGTLVFEQQLSLGQLVAAELVVTRLLLSFNKLTDKLESAYDLVAALDKLGHVLELDRLVDRGAPRVPPAGPASVVVDGIGGAADAVHLSVPAGGVVGVVTDGEASARCLADALSGTLDTDGVRLDGAPLGELSLRALRREVWLLREPDIASVSVGDNLTLGVADAAAARRALDKVGLSGLTLDTRPGPSGQDLSAEVLVRLAVARVLVQAPRVVVVDRLFDRLAPDEAAQLLSVLREDGRWTLIVLTRAAPLCASLPRAFALSGAAFTPLAVGAAS